MKIFITAFLAVSLVLVACSPQTNAQTCNPSGSLRGTQPPGECNTQNDSECCAQGTFYPTYTCSPLVSRATKATLTLNSFQQGGDGGGPPACLDNGTYLSDDTPVVALSTGWYKGGSRCLNFITINGNGRSVRAQVVDECDSAMGCDEEHAYQPRARTTLSMAQKRFGKRWVCQRVTEDC